MPVRAGGMSLETMEGCIYALGSQDAQACFPAKGA